MVRASGKYRHAPPIANVHHEHGVKYGHPQNEHRRKEPHIVMQREIAGHGQASHHHSDEHAAGIAQVNLGWLKIIAQKSQQASTQGGGHDSNDHAVIKHTYQYKDDRTHEGNTRRKTIHYINYIERIDDAN